MNLLVDAGALDKDAMIGQIVCANSPFLSEGKNNLIEEFGKDYGIYFSILSCIARGKNTRSEIEDVFYSFWFRFVFKYSYIIEIENYGKLREIIRRDYNTFSGLMLERYFHRVAMEGGEFTRLGRWWDRRGENEIDMICEDELEDRAVFYEIKRQKEEISIGELKQKAEAMLRATGAFKDYEIGYEGLSMEEM